jgi:osmotically-inducible protein OsmY
MLALGGGADGMAGMITGILHRHEMEKAAVYDRLDVEIGEEIRNDILVFESVADANRFDVAVTDGVVTLTGRPRTCAEGHDIVRRAHHVLGVVAVRDRLDYPPPEPDAVDVLASFPPD